MSDETSVLTGEEKYMTGGRKVDGREYPEAEHVVARGQPQVGRRVKGLGRVVNPCQVGATDNEQPAVRQQRGRVALPCARH